MATNPGQPNVQDEIYSVARLDTPEKLKRKFDELKSARYRYDQQWKLNLAFYNNKQWAYIDRLGRLQTLPTGDADKPRYVVRLVSNQIQPGAQQLLAKLTKTKPIISATPGSASDHDVKAAQMAEDLLEYWWHDLSLDDALEEALLWGIIAGQGYWKITWDAHAGKEMRFLMDPQGQPIVDDAQATAFRGQLSQMGIDPQEQVVYMGDIRVEAMSPFNVYLDPSAKTFKDCKYAICVHYLDPDEIKAKWGVDVKPDSVPTDGDVAVPFDNSSATANKTVKPVYIGYFLPTAALPNGRYVAWIDSPNKILEDSKWDSPTNELPLVKFPGVRVPGRIYDTSVVETALPLQKEMNKTLSQIVEYKNLTIKPRVWAPAGSLRQRITNESGAVYEFIPIAGLKPEVEQLKAMPPYVFDLLQNIKQRLDEIFMTAQINEGTPPPNVEAGVAIDLLQEMASDKLAPTIKLMEHALERAGNLMLQLAQKYYIEPRLMKIKGSGGSVQVRKFTQADLSGGVSVHVEGGSGLPRTRAGRQARIQSYVEMGVLKPEQAWKYLDIADLKSVAQMFKADEDMAYREHEKLIKGVPLNEFAVQAAMQAVASGTNPQTQQPFTSPQEAMAFVQDAALEPQPYENFNIHLDTHGLFLKSVEYEALDTDAQHRFLTHYQKTFEALQKMQPLPPAEPVKTSLQLKGTLGPTGAAEILSKSVPDITPEVMSEPPLDTVVQEFGRNAESRQGVEEPDPMQQTITDQQSVEQSQKMAQGEEAHRMKMAQEGVKLQTEHEKLRKARRQVNEVGKKRA